MQLTVNGHKVHAATGGVPFDTKKPAVLFLHGAGCDHTVWQLQARWFAWHGFAALAVDLPGHGRSEGPPLTSIADLARWTGGVLDAAGVKTAALVGHSMGGSIALEAAAALGDRVTRLALIGTAAAIPVHKDLLTAARDRPEIAYRMMTAWALGSSSKIGGNPAPGMWMSGGVLALFARNAPHVLHLDLAACAAWKTGADAARRVKAPTLVILARQDIMTPPKAGAELARMIEGSRTVMLDASGHMMMAEAPDPVLDALIDFFSKVEAT